MKYLFGFAVHSFARRNRITRFVTVDWDCSRFSVNPGEGNFKRKQARTRGRIVSSSPSFFSCTRFPFSPRIQSSLLASRCLTETFGETSLEVEKERSEEISLTLYFFPRWKVTLPKPGADPGFFLGEGALVSCSTSTPINHIVVLFFCRIPVGGGGVRPLHPPPRSAPANEVDHQSSFPVYSTLCGTRTCKSTADFSSKHRCL